MSENSVKFEVEDRKRFLGSREVEFWMSVNVAVQSCFNAGPDAATKAADRAVRDLRERVVESAQGGKDA